MKKKFNRFKRKRLKDGPRNMLLMILVVVGTLFLLTWLTEFVLNTQSIPYSDFVTAVEQGKVKAVSITDNMVRGVFKQNSQAFETVKPPKAKTFEVLQENGVEYRIVPPSGFQTWHILLFAAFLLSLLSFWYFIRQMKGGGGGPGGGNIFGLGKSRAKMFMPSTVKVTFDDVAGAQTAKEAFRDFIEFLKNPEKYHRLGAKMTNGILLVGDPGNGKTLLAQAVAGEANCPFFSVSGSDFIEVFVGVGASRVRDLFAQARKNAPCIIFIDEIDAIGRHRGVGIGGGHDEREQTLNQLLTEMDGFANKQQNVIVIGATNRPEVLDRALLRRGRFDRHIEIPYPDAEAREEILRIHARTITMDPDIDLSKVAHETAGFTGADLGNLINQATLIASKQPERDMVTQEDFDQARKQVTGTKDSHEVSSGGDSVLGMGKSHVRMFMPSTVKVNFKDVAGAHEAKEDLQDFVDYLKDPEKYGRLGAQMNRGILLEGDPGNGKTLLAKAVAGEANRPFFSVSGAEFVEVFVGVGAARVRDLFAQARKHAPSIVFIDEIDAVGRARSKGLYGGSSEQEQTLNQLLTEMDGFASKASEVIIIAATNRVDILDKALLRPGRFDRTIHVPYPDIKSREKILNIHAEKVKLDPAVDLFKVARGTPGFTGADLAGLINEATLIATKNVDRSVVAMADLDEARDKLMLGKESKGIFMSDKEREIVAYHEAGHALTRLLLPLEHVDPLYKLTIVPRGGALGVTHYLPERDKYMNSKEECMASIISAMGGRAAEELVFNLLASGPGSDFTKATHIARAMVCKYGMSENLGPVTYDPQQNPHSYSERTLELIDNEVKTILIKCLAEAGKILKDNRDKLDLLAKTLLERETLFAHEVYELLGMEPRADFRLA